mmetsp:Transcript_12268/g.36473  ORF Transcript_12268/g.36473 Transcript_12268/m.36473 type:complete len:127 (+) Transcript_12268:171-551(+)
MSWLDIKLSDAPPVEADADAPTPDPLKNTVDFDQHAHELRCSFAHMHRPGTDWRETSTFDEGPDGRYKIALPPAAHKWYTDYLLGNINPAWEELSWAARPDLQDRDGEWIGGSTTSSRFKSVNESL